MTVILLACASAIVLGMFCAVFPENAARIWSAERLRDLPSSNRSVFLWSYRTFGIIFAVAGTLFGLKALGFSNW
jgi:hypothetical protein